VTTTFVQNVQQKWRNLTVRCEMQSNYTIQLSKSIQNN
jgi:spore coat protein U-like protein